MHIKAGQSLALPYKLPLHWSASLYFILFAFAKSYIFFSHQGLASSLHVIPVFINWSPWAKVLVHCPQVFHCYLYIKVFSINFGRTTCVIHQWWLFACALENLNFVCMGISVRTACHFPSVSRRRGDFFPFSYLIAAVVYYRIPPSVQSSWQLSRSIIPTQAKVIVHWWTN